MAASQVNENIRYEPDDRPPLPVSAGVGLQAAAITLPGIALTVVIVARIADQPESYIQWGVFAALLISGITTVLQAARVWRIGSGHVLMMGTSGAFIAVCVAALKEGGPSTMASLIIVSSLFQFLLAARLSLLRRIFTPVVTGTVIMLIAATVMPFVFDELQNFPDGTSGAAAPIAAGVTLAVVGGLILRAPPSWRLWSPLIGVIVGCAVSVPFGMYNVQLILDAPWVGVPFTSWPGLELTPGHEFWALLPAFVVVTLVGAIETIGDGVAIQSVSRREPRATDFRVVQGALNADGVGNLLSGLAGTLPNTTYSSSISPRRSHGNRRPPHRHCYRHHFRRRGLLPQSRSPHHRYPGPRGSSLRDDIDRRSLCAGNENHHRRRLGPPESLGCGSGLLDRYRLPKRVDSA